MAALTSAPTDLVDFVTRHREVRQPGRPPTVPPTDSARVAARLNHGRRWSADGLIGSLVTTAEGARNDRLNWAAHCIGSDVHGRKATREQGDTACEALEHAARLIGLDEN